MFWADKVAQELKKRQLPLEWVDDMKTPSGRIHVGSLRGVILHDLIYKALLDTSTKAKFTYVFDDHDPMDDIPTNLNYKQFEPYLGKPLNRVPPPETEFDSYAQYYATEFKQVFNQIGAHPEIIWTSQLYSQSKMNPGIKKCLDEVSTIRQIYADTYSKKISKSWFPYQVICPNCGKLSTTKVDEWDGNKVHFSCRSNDLKKIDGCGINSKISPFDGNGKLSWKVEWAVKWQVIGVTIEGAGKDHMTAGGSHDIARLVCERILNYPVPYPFAHEFLLVSGQKMSTSKGRGTSAKEMSEIIPPELLRFIMVRARPNDTINFDPGGTTIPDLFDAYDNTALAFWEKKDKQLARIFELSQTKEKLHQKHFLPRFRDVATFIQHPEIDIYKKFESVKGKKLTTKEKDVLENRIKYAEFWLDGYAPKEAVFTPLKTIPEETKDLSEIQISYLQKVYALLDQDWKEPEDLQQALFDASKNTKMSSKDAFASIYLSLIGKTHGPRAAWFLLEHQKLAQKRFKEIAKVSVKQKSSSKTKSVIKSKLISLQPALVNEYPSIKVGYALIRGVKVKKSDKRLEEAKKVLLKSQASLTTEQLGQFPEIQSYRKLYKNMGVNWHSRRPSPEALLRRIALKKGLYSINTCVDAYNLIVMKHRVSSGAFDADNIHFPCQVNIAKGGEKILLLGDKQETVLKKGEISYFDKEGPFNLDYNYRDAQRTLVSEQTKNLWINIDGVYEITRKQVKETLEETVNIIIKYCGGTITQKGIITAS